ncbi:MAG: PAS domain S-box protein [Opitutales bacterium]|jgi:PAS domain S-box-containing protein
MPQPLKMLLVEDSPDDAILLVRELLRAGFDPQWTRVDTEADYLASLHAGLDLVISDYAMPQFDGLRALELLKQRGLDIPFIIVSGTIGEDTAVTAMKNGASDYLIKDRLTRLGPAVSHALDKARLRRESMQTEKELKLFRALMDQGSDTFEVLDAQTGRILDVNLKGCADHGYTQEEYLQLTVYDLAPELPPGAWPERVKAIRRGEFSSVETTHRRKDGSTYPVEISITCVQLDREYIVAVVRNITERKRAEQSLKLFRALVDRGNDGFEVLDPETGQFLDVNERGCVGLGYTREEFLQLKVFEVDPQLTPAIWAERLALIRRNAPPSIETVHRRKDGTLMPVEVSVRCVQLDREYMVAAVRDISERKRAEATLRESEERFRQLAENMTEVFWVTSCETGDILYVSPAYEKIWGRTCESLYQSPYSWEQAIHLDDRQRVGDAFQATAQKGKFDEIYRVTQPDGSMRWIHDRGFPVANAEGKIYRIAGIAEDITKQRRLEEQFRQLQKMEAIGTLAGGIAHDFNNILAAMNGYTDLAKLHAAGNTAVLECLDTVSKAGKRAVDLVRQILTFSRQHEVRRKPIRLQEAVAESLKLLRATIPTTIEFSVDIAASAPMVLGDATQIHQIVMNLGTNALHAMQDRPGRFEVRLQKFEVDAMLAGTHPQLRAGTYARLSVSDTGHGMNRATLERIFEPFFTTKEPGVGTGLGLAVVHGIMQDHDGVITVYSQPGEGTVFHLYFPAYSGEAAAADAAAPAILGGSGKRILYVDDEEILAQMGKKTLERLGYVVEAQTNVIAALAAVRAQPQAYDLVVTDQTMPEMTGTDLAKQLLQIRPDLPIILTTGYSANLTAERVHSLGIRELLMKPHTLQSLALAVQRALA